MLSRISLNTHRLRLRNCLIFRNKILTWPRRKIVESAGNEKRMFNVHFVWCIGKWRCSSLRHMVSPTSVSWEGIWSAWRLLIRNIVWKWYPPWAVWATWCLWFLFGRWGGSYRCNIQLSLKKSIHMIVNSWKSKTQIRCLLHTTVERNLPMGRIYPFPVLHQ